MHLLQAFNDRRNAKNEQRALSAALGSSMAPEGYQPDTAGRAAVEAKTSEINSYGGDLDRKSLYGAAAKSVDAEEGLNSNYENITLKPGSVAPETTKRVRKTTVKTTDKPTAKSNTKATTKNDTKPTAKNNTKATPKNDNKTTTKKVVK